ncbi:forkhead-associated domain-containing protein 1 [Exaiptasia diaphana]|uniref:FHA domain-containing protein n=1 Tax=Exaiptasia diaphana TaxID=2652724 RepID=A0A913YWJ6_EXADI|nr:forkhead-associated domain-containing protein 1 [Exaiptasia diaphana]XP_028519609.1 forkhead-associated domain-containing protein 1 [Exaiptasia diaphana]XP_028519610.1 forkhead-associated domain-containing protein 1 [Exaiptasia diaphana]XP_028519611.1 forkhead-associated domain-containing protein 1 [Exaiptasia diaphana]
MKGCLRAKDGTALHQLRNTVTTVGREGCDLILPYSTIEKQHAVIDFDVSQGCFILQDLNSANGTYVNEHRVQNSAVRLAPGDIVRFGFGNPGYEFGIDQIPNLIYQSTNPPRPQWLNGLSTSQYSSSVSLPYITTGLSSIVDSLPGYQGSQSLTSLPGTGGLVTNDSRAADSWGGGVMPHPPLRSRPASAGTVKPRPVSVGRERPQVLNRGGWVENGVSSPNTSSQHSVEELEERLLRMGDELSRLASYEAECHRKDGIINTLRDEVADLKSKLNGQNFGFR